MARPFEFVPDTTPGVSSKRSDLVRMSCPLCGQVERVSWHPNWSRQATAVARKLHALVGWLIDERDAGRNRCPDCLAKPEECSPVKAVNGTKIVVPPQMSAPARAPEIPDLPRPLSVEEKQKVRLLLDQYFDDAACRYIDGYSDARIGTELDLPWKRVADMREAAYGPIKEDEALTLLRADLDRVCRQIDEATVEVQRMAEGIRALQAAAAKSRDDIKAHLKRVAGL